MDYSKWALSRVDELERRFSDLSALFKPEYDNSFEWRSGNENEYVSGQTKKVISFPAFVASGSVTVFASIDVRFEFESVCTFSFFVDGELQKSQTISGSGAASFFAIKKVAAEDDGTSVLCHFEIESELPLELTVVDYAINVLGKCKKSQTLEQYGKLSADLFEEENGGRVAVAYVQGNGIYCAELNAAEALGDVTGQKIWRGSSVAVAYDKCGQPYVARKTLGGSLEVAALNALSFGILVADDVSDFDIVCAPKTSQASLVVVYVKNGKLFVRYLVDGALTSAQEIYCKYGASTVRAVREAHAKTILLVGGSKNQVLVGSPNAVAEIKGYACSASVTFS